MHLSLKQQEMHQIKWNDHRLGIRKLKKEKKLTKNIAYGEIFAGDPWTKIGADVPTRSVSHSVNGSRACKHKAKPNRSKKKEKLSHYWELENEKLVLHVMFYLSRIVCESR